MTLQAHRPRYGGLRSRIFPVNNGLPAKGCAQIPLDQAQAKANDEFSQEESQVGVCRRCIFHLKQRKPRGKMAWPVRPSHKLKGSRQRTRSIPDYTPLEVSDGKYRFISVDAGVRHRAPSERQSFKSSMPPSPVHRYLKTQSVNPSAHSVDPLPGFP